MELNELKAKFSAVALAEIETEARNIVEATFSTVDLAENSHIIESLYVQPILYSMLLNYLTMHQQYSTLSLVQLASDPLVSDVTKEALASSFATELGVDLTGQEVSSKLMIINSAITSPDRNIKKLQSVVAAQYDKANLVASGASKEIFRNSPEHVLFSTSKFSVPFLYEGIVSKAGTSAILNQPISVADANRYENISQQGRVSGMADVYLHPVLMSANRTISTVADEVTTISLVSRKYAYIDITVSSGEANLTYEFNSTSNLGATDRTIDFICSGIVVADVVAYYYDDDLALENSIQTQTPSVNVSFTGPVPILVDMVVDTEAGLQNFISIVSGAKTTKEWLSLFSAESSKLNRIGNRVSSIDGEMFVNPMMSKPISFFGTNLAIPKGSIMSWVSESNSCIIPRQITVLETGNVTTL